ncbi:MAG: pilus assembly protein PilM, partial [Desulfobacterales bacterium]|nr:pilus assembly protein PilM [Desulfobacterales bacterium]
MLFQTSLGIAIEETSISMVYLRASFKGKRLAAHAVHPLEKEIPAEERGGIIVELVKGFIKENRIASSDIFLTIPREMAIIRSVELPVAVKENLRQTLVYEIEKYVPFSADDIYFDYQVIVEDKENKQLRVLLTVVKKSDLDVFIDITSHLGSGISGIEIHPTALTNYFFWDRR